MLTYQKLDVYRTSIKFYKESLEILQDIPKGQAKIADQLRRASSSVPLNIAEGTGRRKTDDRKNFFNIARGSAMECGAILDVLQLSGVIDETRHRHNSELIHRMVSMLSKMGQ